MIEEEIITYTKKIVDRRPNYMKFLGYKIRNRGMSIYIEDLTTNYHTAFYLFMIGLGGDIEDKFNIRETRIKTNSRRKIIEENKNIGRIKITF